MRWIGAATVGALLAGCYGPNSIHCEKDGVGWICPIGDACGPLTLTCGPPPVDVEACADKLDGDECSSESTAHGYCAAGVCTACSPDVDVCHYDGWQSMTPQGADLHSVWAASRTDAYAVGSTGSFVHYNGSSWTSETPFTSANLLAIWAANPMNMVVLGEDKVAWRFDGSWSASPPATEFLYGVWGAAADDVYAVGRLGLIQHFNGTVWTVMVAGVTGNLRLNGVWGSDASHVFAVGNGIIRYYDGSTWTSPFNDASIFLNAVWGTGANDVYAVGRRVSGGSGGVVLHYNGTWSEVAIPVTIPPVNELKTVWGTSSNDVFAAGLGGALLHYAGGAWSMMTPPDTHEIDGIGGTGVPGNVFAVGLGGVIWRLERE